MDSTDTTEPGAKKGLSRRQVIVGGAVGAAAAWTVPLIDSVPAGATPVAGSNISSACSYFVLVYTITKDGVTTGPFADRVSSTGACGGPTTSADEKWCYTCPGTSDTYDNQGSSNVLQLNGSPLASGGCTGGDGTFNVSGNTITPGSGVTIQFAVAHAGSLHPTTGQAPGTYTAGVCNNSGTVDKVNVACAPITTASFNCLAP
jgi:hypothetical protein